MLERFLNFVRYNNALPIGISLLLLSFSGALAASPEAREAVFSSQNVVRSVDNTYLANADLDSRDFKVRITKISEDLEKYYVDYTYNLLDIKEYVWQEVLVAKTMAVSKKELLGGDLGIFVARELSQLVDSKRAYLKEAQAIARREGVTQKVVTTEYSGLIGKLLDPKEEVFAGYTPTKPDTELLTAPPVSSSTHPVLTEAETGAPSSSVAAAVTLGGANILPPPSLDAPKEYNVPNTSNSPEPPLVIDSSALRSIVEQAVREALAANALANSSSNTTPLSSDPSTPVSDVSVVSGVTSSSGTEPTLETATTSSSAAGETSASTTVPSEPAPLPPDTTAPTITLNGNNPAEIEVGSTYVDLGATVTDDRDQNLGYTMTPDSVDTSTTTTASVTFTATDSAGNTASVSRTVNIR